MARSGFGSELSLRLGSGEGGICEIESKKKKTMTIIYNGEMCVSDLTELQARVIIETAKREMKNENEQKNQQNNNSSNNNIKNNNTNSAVVHHMATLTQPSELSMKRSLQRFLQKRKTRIAATSPYSQNQKEQLLSL